MTTPAPLDPAQPRYGYRPDGAGDPAVSIVTAYLDDGAPFIDTIRAALRQSLQQWEWIVVGHGSGGPTAQRALLPLRSAAARIRVLDRPSSGEAAALNAGAAAARAPLLFFLDPAALLAPTALEQLAWTLESHPGSAYARAAHPCGCLMIRRALFAQAGGFDERTEMADVDALLRRGAANGWRGRALTERLIWPRDAASDPKGRAAPAHDRGARGAAGIIDAYAPIGDDPPFANRLRAEGRRRVLLLLPWIRVGGADQFALDLVAGLNARGDRVSVCLLRDLPNTWLGELRRASSDVFELRAFLDPPDYPRFLRYLIESRQITHVLMSNSLLAYQLLPYLRAHCPSVAFADYTHAEEPWRSGGFPRAAVDHSELLDLHMVSSGHLRDWLGARGVAADRVEVCTVNVDAARWRPDPALRARVRAELGIAEDLPLILFVGRLALEKRPQMVAEALRRLRDEGAPFVALIVGDGEDRPWLRAFIRLRRLNDRVRLLGNVPHERVRALMAAADLLLLPSEREGIALTLYEAMASGVVPVAADVGGQRELVTPECGLLIPPGSDEGARYAAALRRLIDDPALRARMAQAGRARVLAQFSVEHMLDRAAALLDRAESLRRTDPRPPVGRGAGRAAAALAIEHYQLEARLRALPIARPLLGLRQSYAWRLLRRLVGA